MIRAERANGRALPFECVALLLQGGGALGAYQAGVYEALAEADVAPDWIAGISIGAINCALIAGNAPAERVRALRAFWERVSDGGSALGNWTGWTGWLGDDHRAAVSRWSAASTMAQGTPGFFTPRVPPPPLWPDGSEGATSWYDASPLLGTLAELVDFGRIASGGVRVSLGAVDVESGNFAYFDTETHVIGAAHVLASGALPPSFAPVEIAGRRYWDGGLVSNTPLDWVLNATPLEDTLAFQVDLWSARGELPGNLAEVEARQREIQFSSRTRASTTQFRTMQRARVAALGILDKLAPEHRDCAEAAVLRDFADPCVYNIVQLIYRSPPWEFASKAYEFSRAAMEEHWRAGRAAATRALARPEIFRCPAVTDAVQVFDFAEG